MCRAAESSDQVIVVGQVLASEVNIGFENIVNTSVLRINDKPVSNLRQVSPIHATSMSFQNRNSWKLACVRLHQVLLCLDTSNRRKSGPSQHVRICGRWSQQSRAAATATSAWTSTMTRRASSWS